MAVRCRRSAQRRQSHPDVGRNERRAGSALRKSPMGEPQSLQRISGTTSFMDGLEDSWNGEACQRMADRETARRLKRRALQKSWMRPHQPLKTMIFVDASFYPYAALDPSQFSCMPSS